MKEMDFNTGYYADFNTENFISDPFFQEWVIHPDEEKNKFWIEFIETFPLKKDDLIKAKDLLQNIAFKEDVPSDDVIEASFKRHFEAINELESVPIIPVNKTNLFSRKTWWIAAVFTGALAVIAALLFYEEGNKRTTYQTAFGEMKRITLPDSSIVMLNANSIISFNENWKNDVAREVWLDGEAYFNVRHLNNDSRQIRQGERFLVHTKDLQVEVLGTSFNIRQRRGRTEVVLETGSILVTFNDKKHQAFKLKPGNIFTYYPQENKLLKDSIAAEDYTAWKQKKLILQNPTIREITDYLEDNFGKKIVLEDTALYNRRIAGPILFDNLDDALFILSTVLNTNVVKQDSTIILRPR